MTGTPVSSMLLVLFASVIGSFGAVFLKFGAAHLNDGFFHIFNWKAAFGVVLYLLSSVFYVLGVKHGQLSVLFPMVSLGYIWTLFWSRLFFQESFTGQKFFGLGLILLGVVFVGFGS